MIISFYGYCLNNSNSLKSYYVFKTIHFRLVYFISQKNKNDFEND